MPSIHVQAVDGAVPVHSLLVGVQSESVSHDSVRPAEKLTKFLVLMCARVKLCA